MKTNQQIIFQRHAIGLVTISIGMELFVTGKSYADFSGLSLAGIHDRINKYEKLKKYQVNNLDDLLEDSLDWVVDDVDFDYNCVIQTKLKSPGYQRASIQNLLTEDVFYRWVYKDFPDVIRILSRNKIKSWLYNIAGLSHNSDISNDEISELFKAHKINNKSPRKHRKRQHGEYTKLPVKSDIYNRVAIYAGENNMTLTDATTYLLGQILDNDID